MVKDAKIQKYRPFLDIKKKFDSWKFDRFQDTLNRK